MLVKGSIYKISKNISGNFNGAEQLMILRISNEIVQFTLENSKGHGAMPIQHVNHLLKKNELSLVPSKRTFLNDETDEHQIG